MQGAINKNDQPSFSSFSKIQCEKQPNLMRKRIILHFVELVANLYDLI